MERVVFLDRDGTLNEEVCYLYRPEDLHILPGVGEALRMLKEDMYSIIFLMNTKMHESSLRHLHLM